MHTGIPPSAQLSTPPPARESLSPWSNYPVQGRRIRVAPPVDSIDRLCDDVSRLAFKLDSPIDLRSSTTEGRELISDAAIQRLVRRFLALEPTSENGYSEKFARAIATWSWTTPFSKHLEGQRKKPLELKLVQTLLDHERGCGSETAIRFRLTSVDGKRIATYLQTRGWQPGKELDAIDLGDFEKAIQIREERIQNWEKLLGVRDVTAGVVDRSMAFVTGVDVPRDA